MIKLQTICCAVVHITNCIKCKFIYSFRVRFPFAFNVTQNDAQKPCVNPEAWVALKVIPLLDVDVADPPKLFSLFFDTQFSPLHFLPAVFISFFFRPCRELQRSGQKSHLVSVRVIKREIDGSFRTFFFPLVGRACLQACSVFFKSSLCCLLLCPWMRRSEAKQSGLYALCHF